LVNVSKNIKYEISENMYNWSHVLSNEERWTDKEAAGEISCRCLQLFCEGAQTLSTSEHISQDFGKVVKFNTKIGPNGVGSLELARRDLYDRFLITCLRMDVITVPTLLLQSTPS
jgi:hypothetical protein